MLWYAGTRRKIKASYEKSETSYEKSETSPSQIKS
jgi:hypothetical protein